MTRFITILRAQPRPVKFLLATALMRAGLSTLLHIRRPGYRLIFHPSSLSRAMWLDALEREGDADVLRACLRPGDTVIDVGANIGALALCAAACVGERGRVHAIEAHPRTADFLQRNVALNRARHVTVHHCALGERAGRLYFSNRRSDDQNAVLLEAAAGAIEVPVMRLDDLPGAGAEQAGGEIALLKIDVEGYELPVLRGATAVLARTRLVYIEVWDQLYAKYGYTTRDVLELLRGAGFGIFTLDAAQRKLFRFEGDMAAEVTNLLAVREIDKSGRRWMSDIFAVSGTL